VLGCKCSDVIRVCLVVNVATSKECAWLCGDQVQRYPTLHLYRANVRLHDYQKDRDLDSLQTFVLSMLGEHDEL